VTRQRHRLSVVTRPLVLVLALAAVLAYVITHRDATARDEAPAAPAWRADGVACRRDTLEHVHHPTRLIVLARCSTAAGVVQSVRYRPEDGDTEVRLTPDATTARSLPAANRGVVVADIIPTDVARLRLPAAGEHVVLHGAWVLDKNRRWIAKLHPTWAIASRDAPRAAASDRPAAPLQLSVTTPASRGVGEPVPVRVQAVSRTRGVRAEGQVHVFLELTTADGKAVDWRSTTTNTLGDVTINLLALHVPGRYVLHVYANKRGRQAVGRRPLLIKRRTAGNHAQPAGGSPGG
jgi:hypothetical protein